MSNFKVYPTTDIHLLMSAQAKGFTLRFIGEDGEELPSNKISFEGFTDPQNSSQDKVTTSGHTFTPKNVGVVIGKVRYHYISTNFTEVLVRIEVHPGVKDIWFGNNRITLFRNEPNESKSSYVPTVYAKFSDDIVGDVTQHPWLDFSKIGTNVPFNVDDTNDKGRLTADSTGSGDSAVAVGQLKVTAPMATGQKDSQVEVWMRKRLSEKRQILKLIKKGSSRVPKEKRKHILILGEGFPGTIDGNAEAGKKQFIKTAKFFVENLFTRRSEPFYLLKDYFDVWAGCEFTHEPGVTFARPVSAGHPPADEAYNGYPLPESPKKITYDAGVPIYNTVEDLYELVGFPDATSSTTAADIRNTWPGMNPAFEPAKLPDALQPLVDDWLLMKKRGHTQVKDTPLGFMIGDRYGNGGSRSGSYSSVFEWYTDGIGDIRQLGHDPRRTPFQIGTTAGSPPNEDYGYDFESFLDAYFGSLEPSAAKDRTRYDTVNVPFGRKWQKGGKSEGLVAVLLYDDYDVAEAKIGNSRKFYFGLALNKLHQLSLQPNGFKLERSLNLNLPKLTVEIGATFVHELTHAFGLLDEYEDGDNASLYGGGSLPDEKAISECPNLMLYEDVKPQGGDMREVDPDKIFWDWKRVHLAGLLEEDAEKDNPSGHYKAKLSARQFKKWKKIHGQRSDIEVYFRRGDLNIIPTDPNNGPFREAGPLTIVSFENSTRKVVLQKKSGSPPVVVNELDYKVENGSYIFIPKRQVNKPKDHLDVSQPVATIIHPNVHHYMKVNKRALFKKPQDCAADDDEKTKPQELNKLNDHKVRNSTFRAPGARYKIIGLYEGGHHYNCGVYRPSGWSKMRNSSGKVTKEEGNPKPKEIVPIELDFVGMYYIVSLIDPEKLYQLDNEKYKSTGVTKY